MPAAHPGDQLVELERLRQVVVRAAVETGHRVGGGGACGQHDDRHALVEAAHPAQHLEAVDAGQADIEQDQVELVAAGELDRGQAVVGHPAGVPGRGQALRDERRDAFLVLDHQNAAHLTS